MPVDGGYREVSLSRRTSDIMHFCEAARALRDPNFLS